MDIIKALISSYFDVTRKTFVDMVPKTIMYFLVNHFRSELQNELVAKLYRDNEIADLMRETDDIASKRKECIKMKELLQHALDVINQVRVVITIAAIIEYNLRIYAEH